MLELLGQQPNLAESRLPAGAKEVAHILSTGDWETIGHMEMSQEQSIQLSTFLHGFLIFHLGKLPRGRNAALGF